MRASHEPPPKVDIGPLRPAPAADPEAVRTRAMGLLEAGRSREACELLEEQIPAMPFAPELHFIQGKALSVLGRLDEAESSFRRVVFLEPERVQAHFELGRCLHAAGIFSRAVQCYDRAEKLAGQRAASPAGAELDVSVVLYLCRHHREEALDGRPPSTGSPSARRNP